MAGSTPRNSTANADVTMPVHGDFQHSHYGSIHEGYRVSTTTPSHEVTTLRSRYNRRLSLAHFGRFPEGYYLRHTVAGTPVEFLLLTPPGLIAIRHADGTWTRERRRIAVHGPPPYSREFYAEYLRQAQLPEYFMNQHHLGMHSGDPEAVRLRLARRAAAPVPTDIGHLTLPVGEAMLYPTLGVQGDDRSFVIRSGLTDEQNTMLATRFPALDAGNPDFEVVFRPSGILYLRNTGSSTVHGSPTPLVFVDAGEVQWGLASSRQASFVDNSDRHLTHQALPVAPDPSQNSVSEPTSDERERTRDAAISIGGVVNPDREMQGVGHYEWLLPFDAQYGAQAGLDQYEVTRWRQNGILGLDESPSVVWYSDPDFLDPDAQPAGSGHWEYYTRHDEYEAHVNLGGVAQRYALPQFPTASDIWQLRQALRDTDEFEFTDEVRLIWVPEGVNPAQSAADERPHANRALTQAEENAAQGVLELSTEKLLSANQSSNHSPAPPSSEDGIDPTNGFPGGPIDQTGADGKAQYQQAQIGDRLIVVDRSDPVLGQPEHHLLWVRARSGWLHYECTLKKNTQMNWNDFDMLEALKNWRRQSYRRGHFGLKRSEQRESYTEEQRDWVMDQIKAHLGANLSAQGLTRQDLAQRFNTRFGASRSVNGLATLHSRMVKEWEKHGGRAPHRDRGWNQKELSKQNTGKKRKRPEGEEEDEDADADFEEDDG